MPQGSGAHVQARGEAGQDRVHQGGEPRVDEEVQGGRGEARRRSEGPHGSARRAARPQTRELRLRSSRTPAGDVHAGVVHVRIRRRGDAQARCDRGRRGRY